MIISLLLLKTSAGPILSDLPPKLLWGVASSAGFMTAGPGEILSTGGSDSSFLPVWGDTDEAVKGRQKGGCLFGLKVGFFSNPNPNPNPNHNPKPRSIPDAKSSNPKSQP